MRQPNFSFMLERQINTATDPMEASGPCLPWFSSLHYVKLKTADFVSFSSQPIFGQNSVKKSSWSLHLSFGCTKLGPSKSYLLSPSLNCHVDSPLNWGEQNWLNLQTSKNLFEIDTLPPHFVAYVNIAHSKMWFDLLMSTKKIIGKPNFLRICNVARDKLSSAVHTSIHYNLGIKKWCSPSFNHLCAWM